MIQVNKIEAHSNAQSYYKTWKMDKEDVVHKYNVILLSHKKEWIWVNYIKVDEPRACYTEWSKSEREKQILYTMHIYGI